MDLKFEKMVKKAIKLYKKYREKVMQIDAFPISALLLKIKVLGR